MPVSPLILDYTFRDTIRFTCPAAGINGRCQSEGPQPWEDWIEEYRLHEKFGWQRQDLLTTGRKIGQWLEKLAPGWLKQAETLTPPVLLEIRVPASPSYEQQAFLEVPWELLAGEENFLAEREYLMYCPVRRQGEPTMPASPADHRLALTFMAAAPEGQQELMYEREESAIQKALGMPPEIDLRVEESGNLVQLGSLLLETLLQRIETLNLQMTLKDGRAVTITRDSLQFEKKRR